MRLLLRATITILVLLILFGGGFYLVQSGRAKRQGEEYTLAQLPADVVQFLKGLADSGEEVEVPPSPSDEPSGEDPASFENPPVEPEDEASADEPEAATGSGESDWGRERYDRGDFRGAMHAWQISLSLHWDPQLKRQLEQARLFAAVRARFPEPTEANGETTIVEVRSGATFAGHIVSRDDERVRLAVADGKVLDLPTKDVVGTRTVGAEQRRAELEQEFEQRRAAAEEGGPKAYLELAEWTHVHGFPERLPALFETLHRLEAEQGAVLGPYLAEAYPDLTPSQQDRVAQVLDRFYPTTPGVREILLARMGVQPVGSGGFANAAPTTVGSGSRITKDFIERADRAKELAKKGEAYYLKAQPGMPNRVRNREKALELLTESKDLFEELLDERPRARWLEKYLQKVYVMHRWLRKDTPVK
jgi:hypothetical protein